MADRRVTVVYEAQIANYKAAMKDAASSTEELAKKAEAAGTAEQKSSAKRVAAAKTLAPAVTAAGVATLAGFALAAKGAADFDQAMSNVRAATHETATNMDLLREAAVRAGADTAFSAVEAASAIEELSKAGVATKDILSGGLDGALGLAAAGGLSVAEAAETAASAMTQFKLSGEAIPHIADLLAAGAGKAQGSVHDLGAALNQAGLVANSTGLTIEETTGGLAAFASAGLIGSDAGTSFKSMLQRLTPQSEKAATLMDELGLSAYDSQGEFVGLSEYAGKLQGALSEMSSEQRNATLTTLFGSDAVRAATVLYEQGADGVEKWEGAVNDAGYAAETAAIKQDNLRGDLEKLGGAFDTVLIQSGSGANEALRGLVQGLEGVVDTIGSIPGPVLSVAGMLAGVAGGAAILGGGLITVLPKIRDTKEALEVLAPAGSKARGAIAGVGKAAGIAGIALGGLMVVSDIFTRDSTEKATDFAEAMVKVANAGGDASKVDFGKVFGEWDSSFGQKSVDVSDMAGAVERLSRVEFGQGFNEWADDFFSAVPLAKSETTQLKDRMSDLGDEMGRMVSSGNAETAAQTFSALAGEFQKNGKDAAYALEFMPGYSDALRQVAVDAGVAVTDQELLNWALTGTAPASVGAAQGLEGIGAAGGKAGAGAEVAAGGIEDTAAAAEKAAEALDKMLDGLVATGQIALSEAAALDGFEAAVDDAAAALEKNGKTLDNNTEKGRANRAALRGIADESLGVVESQKEAGRSADVMADQLQKGRDAFIAQAVAMGVPKAEAKKLADQYGLVPSKVYTAFASNAPDLAAKLEVLHDQIQSTPNKTITISDNSPETIAGLEALGYKVETLPNGKIKVTETGADDVGKKIDGVASKERTAIIKAAADAATSAAANENLNWLARSRTMVVTVQTNGSASIPSNARVAPKSNMRAKFATGGAVFGAGTATSDSIPALLSNGEHVLTASEVKSLGGHDAVYRFRRQLQTAPGFAVGGEVGAARYAVPSASLAAQSVAASGGGGGINLGGIKIYGATDANEVRRAVMDELSYKFQRQGVRLG